MIVSFFAPGLCGLKGSTSSAPFRRANGKLGVRTFNASARQASWARIVSIAALAAVREQRGTAYQPTTEPVVLRVAFLFERPKSHGIRFGRGRGPGAPAATSRAVGDLDKLLRGVCDPMTGVVYADDSQIVRVEASKGYCEAGEVPGARVVVMLAGDL